MGEKARAIETGWYHTTGGYLARVFQVDYSTPLGQAAHGQVVNIGTFLYDAAGKVLKQAASSFSSEEGLDLDLASWRSLHVLSSPLCELHCHLDCVACVEGHVPLLPERIQTGDIVVKTNNPSSPRMRVTAMSLDGQGGSFEVIKKNGLPDRRYECWSGSFHSYQLVEKKKVEECH